MIYLSNQVDRSKIWHKFISMAWGKSRWKWVRTFEYIYNCFGHVNGKSGIP